MLTNLSAMKNWHNFFLLSSYDLQNYFFPTY